MQMRNRPTLMNEMFLLYIELRITLRGNFQDFSS